MGYKSGGLKSPTKEPPQEPPQPKQTTENQKYDDVLANLDMVEAPKQKHFRGVIFKAINHVENDFLFEKNKKREVGIVTEALNHICKNVYRSQMTF